MKRLIIIICIVASSIASFALTTTPSLLTATSLGGGSIKLDWTVPTNSSVVGYTIVYNTAAVFSGSSHYVWNGGPNTKKTFTITGLLPNSTYYFSVKSEGNINSNDSQFSSWVSQSTSIASTTPPVITGISCVASANSIQVNYTINNPANAIGYTIRSSTDSGFANSLWSWAGNSLSYNLTGLPQATTYYFQVKSEGPADSLDSQMSVSTSCTTASGPILTGLPQFDHIVIYIMENHGYSQMVGNGAAPNFNGLISGTKSALMTQSYGLTHPSQPNYLYLFSGSNQGITGDQCPVGPFSSGNIFQQLGGISKSYAAYSQNLPSIGNTTCGSNGYGRKHCPWVNFNNVDHGKEFTMNSFPNGNFSSLPYLSYIIPDDNHNWHNGDLAAADNYIVSSGFKAYSDWAKNNNSLAIITFDEDDFTPVNRIPTVFIGAYVNKGSYSQTINHCSVLKMLEDMNGLPKLGCASGATPIDFCWSSTPMLIQGLSGISHEDPYKTVYYDFNGNLLRDTINKPKNQILIKSELFKDSIRNSKFIINETK